MPSPAKSPSRKSASPARKQSPVAKKPGRRRSIDPEKIIRPNRVNARPWADLEDEALVVLVAELGPVWSHVAQLLGTGRSADAIKQRFEEIVSVERPPASLLVRLTHTSVPLWWHGLARANTFYWCSSFAYGAAGMLIAYVNSKQGSGWPKTFPYEWVIYVGQSVLTYMSDVATLGSDSTWHALDRVYAYTFTILRSTLAFAAFYYYAAYSRIQMAVLAIGLAVALFSIRRSWIAVMDGVKTGSNAGWPAAAQRFFFWHGLWHYLLPATAATMAILELSGYGA